MAISLKPEYLKRYRDAARLMLKYGNSDLVKKAGLERAIEPPDMEGDGHDAKAEELAKDLEKLGPTYIKLGQLLSTRADLLPPAYLQALSRLQDDVEPFPFQTVEHIVRAELGVRISKAFQEFESEPMAAASLGQVHRAVLRDGRRVAVKVQRPDIRERIAEDLDAFEQIAEFLDKTEYGKQYQFGRTLDEFRKTLYTELDYRKEAENLKRIGSNLADFDRIYIPAPIDDYTTSRVLTMEYVTGTKITLLSPVARTEIDARPLIEQLQKAYLHQILVDGFFHADPHPGNVFLTDDGRIALIDLGMVARITPVLQEDLLRLLLAISDGRGEEAAEVGLAISDPRPGYSEKEFRRRISDLVSEFQDVTVEQIQVGFIVMQVTAIAADCKIRVPAELTMLGKTLLNLDEIARVLDPTFDPNEAMRRNATDVLNRRMLKSLSPGNVMSGVLDLKEFLNKLPARSNKLLENLSNNEFEIRVNALDETRLMEGFQKIANRIAVGLVLAALIIGAAMLMQVDTEWTIMGYPALAMIFFMVAAAGGVGLIIEIILHDRSSKSAE